MTTQVQDYALVIGLNDYPRFGTRGRSLEGAIQDAQSFRDWLVDDKTGGGVPEENCKLILSTPEPLLPTQLEIDQKLLEIKTSSNQTGARRLYFYFSGHGQAGSSQDIALCLTWWSQDFRHAALAWPGYEKYLLDCTTFTEIVVFLDCCRTRTIDASALRPQVGCALPVDNAGRKRKLIAYAAEFQNAAYEGQAAARGDIDDDGPLVRGHFTTALLNGLGGGAARPEGGVTANALKAYLEQHVPRIAKDNQHEQTAVVDLNFPQAEQPIFGSAVPMANACISFSAERNGRARLDGPMSASDHTSPELFPFTVRVRPGEGADDAQVTVFDGHGEVRKSATGAVETALSRGLYTVRVQLGTSFHERHVAHDGPTDLTMPAPKWHSPVPSADSGADYLSPAVVWSQRPTGSWHLALPPTGSLLVFVRTPAPGTGSFHGLDIGLSLFDYDGKHLADFDGSSMKVDDRTGWAAFHAELTVGGYVLHYHGNERHISREMALSVFEGWQTQLFMTYAGGPVFGSASMLTSRAGFEPGDPVTRAVEAAVAELHNGLRLTSDSQRALLEHPTDNPMLALVGAYRLLTTGLPMPSELLDDLRALVGRGPDVCALQLIAAEARGTEATVLRLERPPLLGAGLDAILRAAARQPGVVLPGSMLSRIGPRRYADCPWSTWEPVLHNESAAPPSWVTNYVQDAMFSAARRDDDLELSTVAEQTMLPQESIATAFNHVRATMKPSRLRTLEQESMIARARSSAAQSTITIQQAREQFGRTDGDRIEILGLMQGSEALRDLDMAIEAISASRSAFEQYHALKLARMMLPRLDQSDRNRLNRAILRQREPGGYIQPGTDRWTMSELILDELSVRAPEPLPAPPTASLSAAPNEGALARRHGYPAEILARYKPRGPVAEKELASLDLAGHVRARDSQFAAVIDIRRRIIMISGAADTPDHDLSMSVNLPEIGRWQVIKSETNLTDQTWMAIEVTTDDSTHFAYGNDDLNLSRTFAKTYVTPDQRRLTFYEGEVRPGEAMLEVYTIETTSPRPLITRKKYAPDASDSPSTASQELAILIADGMPQRPTLQMIIPATIIG
jgi:hypothetical protein